MELILQAISRAESGVGRAAAEVYVNVSGRATRLVILFRGNRVWRSVYLRGPIYEATLLCDHVAFLEDSPYEYIHLKETL